MDAVNRDLEIMIPERETMYDKIRQHRTIDDDDCGKPEKNAKKLTYLVHCHCDFGAHWTSINSYYYTRLTTSLMPQMYGLKCSRKERHYTQCHLQGVTNVLPYNSMLFVKSYTLQAHCLPLYLRRSRTIIQHN